MVTIVERDWYGQNFDKKSTYQVNRACNSRSKLPHFGLCASM
jgi:hypothetical protein